MSTAGTRPARRWPRRLAIISFLALLLLGAAALLLPRWLDADRLIRLALARASEASGLAWTYTGRADLRWRPFPRVRIPGLEARDTEGGLVLEAAELELALPWSTLRGEALRIDGLRLAAPRLDLEAANRWWASRPATAAARLPELRSLAIRTGELRWSGGRIEALDLTLPQLAVGRPLALEARGRLMLEGQAPLPLAVLLEGTLQIEPLRLDDLMLRLEGEEDGPIPPLRATGGISLTPWRLRLTGELARWPAAWPALPAPLAASNAPIVFHLRQEGQEGEGPLDAPASLDLRRDATELQASGRPAALRDWLGSDTRSALPPLRLEGRAPRLELEGVVLEDVEWELGE